MSELAFVNALNESAVTFVSELAAFGWTELAGPGFEAISPDGEIRAFSTYREANEWRLAEVRAVVAWRVMASERSANPPRT